MVSAFTPSQGVALALLLASTSLVASAGPVGPAPDSVALDLLCDAHGKHCQHIEVQVLGLQQLQGEVLDGGSGGHSQSPVEPLHKYMDEATYQTLRGIVPQVAPLPVPGRPTGVGLGVAANASLEVKTHGLLLQMMGNLTAHSSANVTNPPPAEPGQVPCSDGRGCPDLLVDPAKLLEGTTGLRTFGAGDCSVVEGSTQPGTRRLMRFTFATPNLGDGDLVVGDPNQHPEWFEWGACHQHWHFRQYAAYRLWTLGGYIQWRHARNGDPGANASEVMAAHPGLASQFIAGHKQGFCVEDVSPYVPMELSHYRNCGYEQGISRGWADEYGASLDGQWIDITDVPPGHYVLEAEANPGHLYRELDYANNSGAALVVVPPTTGGALPTG
jgi:hypothetical protein